MIASQDRFIDDVAAAARRSPRAGCDACQCRPQLERDGTRRRRRHFRPDPAAAVSRLSRQDAARRASRHRVRTRAPRTAAGLARHQGHGCRAALRLSPFRAVFGRVSPPLRRDAVADAEAAGPVRGRAGVDAFAVCAAARPADGRLWPDRGSRGKSGDRRRYRRRSRHRADPRRDFGGTRGAIGALSSGRRDPGIGSRRRA